MNELFTKDLARSTALLNSAKHRHDVGAFEGANYESTGYFRPEMQCIMFDRSEKFATSATMRSSTSSICIRADCCHLHSQKTAFVTVGGFLRRSQ
jgi:hypothetical protein